MRLRVLPAVVISILTALSAVVYGGVAEGTASAASASSHRVSYELHMVFFSQESGQSHVIDPQMFIASPGTPAGTGPQGIYHAANLAPAPMNAPPQSPLFAADGSPLHVSLGQWERAQGSANLVCGSRGEMVASQFKHLVPGGVYSLFVVHLTVQGVGRFTPLGDANGTANNFVANPAGQGHLAVHSPQCLTPSSKAVVLVWHSDKTPHGPSIGAAGQTSHNQLIFRVP